jgi:hypothetical protein
MTDTCLRITRSTGRSLCFRGGEAVTDRILEIQQYSDVSTPAPWHFLMG